MCESPFCVYLSNGMKEREKRVINDCTVLFAGWNVEKIEKEWRYGMATHVTVKWSVSPECYILKYIAWSGPALFFRFFCFCFCDLEERAKKSLRN